MVHPIIPALSRPRQEGLCKFTMASLGYIMSLRLSFTARHCLKKNNRNKMEADPQPAPPDSHLLGEIRPGAHFEPRPAHIMASCL